jgi:hypothetical protein
MVAALAVGPVREVPLERLRLWARNPRRITAARLEDLQRALLDDPGMLWARPLIALPDGTVIAGNQRLRAALALGWDSIPVFVLDADPERVRLVALRDNNAWGDWDEPSLAELLDELGQGGLDLALTGFEGRDIDRILAGLGQGEDPDQLPPLPAGRPESKPGEIYEFGAHLLLCGDSTDADEIARVAAAGTAACLLSPRPFGASHHAARRARISGACTDTVSPATYISSAISRFPSWSAAHSSHPVGVGGPVIHRLEPLPRLRQHERRHGVDGLVELRVRHPRERPPHALHERPIPVRSALVAVEQGVARRRARRTGRGRVHRRLGNARGSALPRRAPRRCESAASARARAAPVLSALGSSEGTTTADASCYFGVDFSVEVPHLGEPDGGIGGR